MGLPKPDLVVFLQLRLAEAAARGEFGRERYESAPVQERALQCFQQLMGDTTLNWRVSEGIRPLGAFPFPAGVSPATVAPRP